MSDGTLYLTSEEWENLNAKLRSAKHPGLCPTCGQPKMSRHIPQMTPHLRENNFTHSHRPIPAEMEVVQKRRKWIIRTGIVLMAAGAAGAGYAYWKKRQPSQNGSSSARSKETKPKKLEGIEKTETKSDEK